MMWLRLLTTSTPASNPTTFRLHKNETCRHQHGGVALSSKWLKVCVCECACVCVIPPHSVKLQYRFSRNVATQMKSACGWPITAYTHPWHTASSANFRTYLIEILLKTGGLQPLSRLYSGNKQLLSHVARWSHRFEASALLARSTCIETIYEHKRIYFWDHRSRALQNLRYELVKKVWERLLLSGHHPLMPEI